MSSLAGMGLGLYDLIPGFQERCPLCEGSGCAVRHGLYFRQAAHVGGAVYERFPVPRFLCRRKGPQRPQARTFSVLPAALVPRRHFSLGLMLWLVGLVLEGGRSVGQALDRLAEECRQSGGPLCPDETAVCRLIELFCRGYQRLQSFPLPGVDLGSGVRGKRPQARALCRHEHGQRRRDPRLFRLVFFHDGKRRQRCRETDEEQLQYCKNAYSGNAENAKQRRKKPGDVGQHSLCL